MCCACCAELCCISQRVQLLPAARFQLGTLHGGLRDRPGESHMHSSTMLSLGHFIFMMEEFAVGAKPWCTCTSGSPHCMTASQHNLLMKSAPHWPLFHLIPV